MLVIPDSLVWIVVLGFVVAFVLAFGIGANDVANSFGTSVCSKVLTLRQACLLATVFETAGSVLLGAKVSDTIRKGILHVDMFTNDSASGLNGTDAAGVEDHGIHLLLVGQLASLVGSCVLLLSATFMRLPVSGTHSIVGATIGFALVVKGTRVVNWSQLLLIASSWFISPLLSGALSVALFLCIKYLVLLKEDALEPGLRLLPLIYSITIAINVFSTVYDGPDLLKFNEVPLWAALSISFAVAIACSLAVKLLLIPWQRGRIVRDVQAMKVGESTTKRETAEKAGNEDNDVDDALLGVDEEPRSSEDAKWNLRSPTPSDRPEQARIFSWLQVLTAVFGSFAHGGNDVSNAIWPLVGMWIIATTGSVGTKSSTPIFVLIFGCVGISLGLWLLGRRVIKTLGEELTTITPSSGFCIELGAALAVLLASNIGVPISTTHCKVGSVVLVGWFRSRDGVRWSVFGNIIVAWIVTLPVSCAVSAGSMLLLRAVAF